MEQRFSQLFQEGNREAYCMGATFSRVGGDLSVRHINRYRDMMLEWGREWVFIEGITMTERGVYPYTESTNQCIHGTVRIAGCTVRNSHRVQVAASLGDVFAGDLNNRKHLQGEYVAYVNNAVEDAGAHQCHAFVPCCLLRLL